MVQAGSITAALLFWQAEQLHLVDEQHVVILAGRAYTSAALTVWPHATTPLSGAGGLGRQLAVLAGIACTGLARSRSVSRRAG